ncbi:MAG: hypothetical protein A2284_08655 [Deltaproteobacteria bacterium RIFOXYA12_FULL_61_11]|nr:MAG: hypothetical protein A2284_08655 [Deltaproteobacteria bacterium RIFOXYA12_FULL_61_11]
MIKGPTSIIRALEPRDFDIMFKYWDIDEVNFYTISCSFPRSRERFEKIYSAVAEGENSRYWGICDLEGTLVGNMGVYDMDQYVRSCLVGFHLFPPYRGKGLGTSSLLTGLRYVFGDMNYQRVGGETNANNRAAISMLEKLGFTREGVVRRGWRYRADYHDKVLYGMLREEFQTLNPAPPA